MSEKPMKYKEYYAHSVEGSPPEGWHRLEDHLKNVAEMAREFGSDFNAGDWGYLAGLWQYLGKCSFHLRECSVSSTKRTARSV
jgi:hypothetical protein